MSIIFRTVQVAHDTATLRYCDTACRGESAAILLTFSGNTAHS